MAEKAALLERIGNIAKITMNNPASLNSMIQALLDDTRAALRSDKLDLQAGIELETGIQLFCLGTEDHREGMDAFLAKRPPVFKDR
ncbi:MAG TPA: hypothetical protein PLA30_08000 [Smithellaceae bacterium]|nr:hypothetical protein [Smithellaceae bacterium]